MVPGHGWSEIRLCFSLFRSHRPAHKIHPVPLPDSDPAPHPFPLFHIGTIHPLPELPAAQKFLTCAAVYFLNHWMFFVVLCYFFPACRSVPSASPEWSSFCHLWLSEGRANHFLPQHRSAWEPAWTKTFHDASLSEILRFPREFPVWAGPPDPARILCLPRESHPADDALWGLQLYQYPCWSSAQFPESQRQQSDPAET